MNDWKFSKEYKKATKTEQGMLDELADIMYKVQYAKMGNKAEARRRASLYILTSVKEAYKTYKKRKPPISRG